MKKNIRKYKVNSVEEIIENLKEESNELAEFFRETSNKIGNDKLVVFFWNLMVKHQQNNKSMDEYDMASLLTMFGTGQVLHANGNYLGAIAVNLAEIGLATNMIANQVFSDKIGSKALSDLDKLVICEPELYDIELVFNGYTRDMIDTSEYDGKAEYQKIHDEFSAKDHHKTKLQVYDENEDIKSI